MQRQESFCCKCQCQDPGLGLHLGRASTSWPMLAVQVARASLSLSDAGGAAAARPEAPPEPQPRGSVSSGNCQGCEIHASPQPRQDLVRERPCIPFWLDLKLRLQTSEARAEAWRDETKQHRPARPQRQPVLPPTSDSHSKRPCHAPRLQSPIAGGLSSNDKSHKQSAKKRVYPHLEANSCFWSGSTAASRINLFIASVFTVFSFALPPLTADPHQVQSRLPTSPRLRT